MLYIDMWLEWVVRVVVVVVRVVVVVVRVVVVVVVRVVVVVVKFWYLPDSGSRPCLYLV